MRYRARGGAGCAGGGRPVMGPRCKINMRSSTLLRLTRVVFTGSWMQRQALKRLRLTTGLLLRSDCFPVVVAVVVGSSGRQPHRNEVRARQW